MQAHQAAVLVGVAAPVDVEDLVVEEGLAVSRPGRGYDMKVIVGRMYVERRTRKPQQYLDIVSDICQFPLYHSESYSPKHVSGNAGSCGGGGGGSCGGGGCGK